MSSLKNSISVSTLDLLGIVLLLIFEKLKNIIVHHQFHGKPLLKECQLAVVIMRTGAMYAFLEIAVIGSQRNNHTITDSESRRQL